MNINSNAMSAIVDSLFRLVRDGSALHGPFGPRHRGAVGATGKQAVLYAFGSLSAVLWCVVCQSIDRSVCEVPMHLEQACCVWRCRGRASETKDETYSVT